jgi:hypothetical protein
MEQISATELACLPTGAIDGYGGQRSLMNIVDLRAASLAGNGNKFRIGGEWNYRDVQRALSTYSYMRA